MAYVRPLEVNVRLVNVPTIEMKYCAHLQSCNFFKIQPHQIVCFNGFACPLRESI